MSLATHASLKTKLPAPACTAATERASAETAEASSAASPAKSSSTKATTAAHHSADHRADPPTAPSTASAPAASAPNDVRDQGDQKDYQYDYEDWTGPFPLLFSTGSARRRQRRGSAERHAAILRDDVRDTTSNQQQRSVVVSVTQVRNRLTTTAAHLAIRKNRFEAVPHRRPILVVLRRNEDQYSAVGLFRANSPLCREANGKILDRLSIERLDGDHRNLGLSLLIHLGAKRREQVLSWLAQDAGKVVHVACRFRFGKTILGLRTES